MQKRSRIAVSLIYLSLTACNNDLIDLSGEQHVRVYQDDQALACADSGGISVTTHGQLLIDENIELHCAQKGDDGMSYTESCGSETGSINIFTIHTKDLGTAESLGFSRLSSLPDAQFDQQCESKVISDHRKYQLIDQLNDQYTLWQSNNYTDYHFQFHMNYSDCPTFAPTPTVNVTIRNNIISTVYDIDNDTFLTNTSDYMTIDELFKTIDTQLKLTPLKAGFSAGQPDATPTFNTLGAPEQYFINPGEDTCDAANYTISQVAQNHAF